MGAYLSEPITKKHRESGCLEKYGGEYATCSMQGWRKHQEDAHIHPRYFVRNASDREQDGLIFAGVYDGHGGAEIARYAASNIIDVLVDLPEYKAGAYEKAMQKMYLRIDEKIKTPQAQSELKKLEEAALHQEKVDRQEMREGREKKKGANSKEKSTASASGGSEIQNNAHEELPVAAEQKPGSPELEKDALGDAGDTEAVVLTPEMFEGITNSEDFEKKIMSIIAANHAGSDPASEEQKKSAKAISAAPEKREKSAHVHPNEGKPDSESMQSTNDKPTEASSFSDGSSTVEQELDPDSYGIHSGCTATSVLIVNYSKVICANAGDTRCVLSRGGVAIPLSRDHNPDQKDEYERIYKAGGTVNEEGRVEGNLNLSRALGDLFYKENKAIPAEEQMITSNPEIQTITLSPKDEFLIIACDGIWNVMENQEVIDFIRKALSKGSSLADAAAALCDACLSDGSDGDGTGCDNESVVLLQLNKSLILNKGEPSDIPRVVSGGPPSALKRRNDDDAESNGSPGNDDKRRRKSPHGREN